MTTYCDNQDVRDFAGLAADHMKNMMDAHSKPDWVMDNWDPQRQRLRNDVWENEKYEHLFSIQ
jgi:hypothetical protein